MLATLAWMLIAFPSSLVASETQYISATRHIDTVPSVETSFPAWIAAGSRALSGIDSPTDFSCEVEFESGGVTDFDFAPHYVGVIDEEPDYDILLYSIPERDKPVKIVVKILTCGGSAPPGQEWAGCTYIDGGNRQIVLPEGTPDWSNTLFHELGHYNGLPYDPSVPRGRVMYEFSNIGGEVTEEECAAFRHFLGSRSLYGSLRRLDPGVTDEFLISIGTGAKQFLIGKLAEPAADEFYEGIISRLRVAGEVDVPDGEVTAALIGFVDRYSMESSTPTRSVFFAMRSALEGIGLRGGKRGLDYLTDWVAEAGRADKVSFSAGFVSAEHAGDLLRRSAVKGLGYSQEAAALARLRAFRASPPRALYPSNLRIALDAAIRTNEKIRKSGLKQIPPFDGKIPAPGAKFR